MPTIPFTGPRGMRLPMIVVAATAMMAASKIIHHHLYLANLSHPSWSHPVVQNFTAVTRLGFSNSSLIVEHAANGTWNPADHIPKTEPSKFYTWFLAHELLFFAIRVPLQYYWHLWLERILPMRPRGDASMSAEKVSVGEGDQVREEEIVKRWIASGKVKRASLSWWNTFLKWILDITVGQFIFGVVDLVRATTWKRKFTYSGLDLVMECALPALFYLPSIYTFASLLSMALVPARHRVLFKQGIGLLGSVFLSVAMYVIFPRLQVTSMGQTMLKQFTEGAWLGAHDTYARDKDAALKATNEAIAAELAKLKTSVPEIGGAVNKEL